MVFAPTASLIRWYAMEQCFFFSVVSLSVEVVCEAHHNTLPLAPFIKWDLAAKSSGAHNSVHSLMGLDRAHGVHNLCTIWVRIPSQSSVHTDCIHLQQHNRAFTMGVNKPYPSLSSHLNSHQRMQLLQSLYSFSAVWIPQRNLIHVEKGFQSPLWSLYTFLLATVLTDTVSETVEYSFIGLVVSQISICELLPISLYFLHYLRNRMVEVWFCLLRLCWIECDWNST